MLGTMYLIHFKQPVRGKLHYLGWTPADVLRRFETHQTGNGSELTKAAFDSGTGMVLARKWDRVLPALEKTLKRGGNLKRHCPICVPESANTSKISGLSRRTAG